ncbi:MAG: hypothetical protein JJ855_18325 [Rhodospirillales bacterium]|nr:hypothetical protein [Rhodospirillales bacterium]
MSAVVAIMLVAACDPDLLHCLPVFHWDKTWMTVNECRQDRHHVAAIVDTRFDGKKTVMTDCRLYLDEHRAMPRPTPAITDGPALF